MALIEMDLIVRSEIGIAPRESGRVQSLLVTLRVEVADQHSDAAACSGQITDTLDYSRLRQIVIDTFKERRWALLEQITTTVRDRIRRLDHVVTASVGVTKSHAWPDVPRLALTR
jgi:dihydroneopterin aldolase